MSSNDRRSVQPIADALREIAGDFRKLRSFDPNRPSEALLVFQRLNAPQRAGELIVSAWKRGQLRQWPRLGKLVAWIEDKGSYPGAGSPYNEFERAGLERSAQTIFYEVCHGILAAEYPGAFNRIGQPLMPASMRLSRNDRREALDHSDRQSISEHARACEAIAKFIEAAERSKTARPPTTITQAEFAQISGLNPGTVSRHAKDGTPITLEKARQLKATARTARRSTRVESTGEVQRKFQP